MPGVPFLFSLANISICDLYFMRPLSYGTLASKNAYACMDGWMECEISYHIMNMHMTACLVCLSSGITNPVTETGNKT